MNDSYRQFYEKAGQCYPEDELTYSSLSGLARQKWVAAALRRFLRPGNLLDCGSNIGRLSQAWRHGPVFAIDLARQALIRGRRRFPHVHFIHADLRDLSFIRAQSITNAIVIETLEHLPEPGPFLTNLYQVLKPGGRVLITTPGYSRIRPRLLSLGVLQSYGISEGAEGVNYFHTAYKPCELAELVRRAGFMVLAQGGFEHESRGWVRPLMLLIRLYSGIAERWFPGSHLNIMVYQGLRRLELNLFYFLDTFGFSRLLKKIFPEGRRSYVVAQK